jgi:predicted ATPase
LAPLQSLEVLASTLAQALNFSFYEGGDPWQQLLDYLRSKNMLLVMDNLEHLLASVQEGSGIEARLIHILNTAAQVKLLVTSRAKLGVQGEYPLPLAGLEVPPLETLATTQEPTQYSAVELFRQSARRVQLDFQLSADNWPSVAQICQLVSGMPLGIILAANWLDLLNPAEVATQIQQNLDFLTIEGADLPERQRSMRAVFNHSWRLLTERERHLFSELSVFRGGFDQQAAQAVTGASLPELRGLVNKSFLQRTATGRYEIHELLRQFGAEKMDEQISEVGKTSEISGIHDSHSAYYCAFVQAREVDLKGAQQLALAEIQVDYENIRLAWSWAAEQGQIERLAQAMDSLGFFYQWGGRFQEGEAAYRNAVANLVVTPSGNKQPVPFSNRLRVLTKLLSWQADFSYTLGQFEHAEDLLQQGLALIDNPELANQDIRLEKARILRQIGSIAENNRRENARPLLEESLAIYRSLNDKEGIARSLSVLSQAVMYEGELEEAERLAQESLAIYREIGSQPQIALGLLYLGMKFLILGRFVETHILLEESITIQSNYGARGQLVEANITLGWAKVMLGRYEEAHILLQQTLSLAKEIGYQNKVASAFTLLGWVALAETDYAEAQQFLQQKSMIYREIGQQDDGSTPAMLGCATRSLGQLSQAQQYLVEALRLASETRSFPGLLFTLSTLALLLIDQGEPERAVELYALASLHQFVANSRWFEDVAGQHVAAAAADLPVEVVAAAQERGRAQDIWATAVELLAELEKRERIPGSPG